MKIKRTIGSIAVACLASAAVITSCCFLPNDEGEKLDLSGMSLVWEDNFSTLDTATWTHEVWAAGKVNNEKQQYIKGNTQIVDDDGALDGKALRITAKNESGAWKSARIKTENATGDKSWKYGYIEARIKLPLAYDSAGNLVSNNGVWPAFWLMPHDPNGKNGDGAYGTWPASGEIDILEYSPSTSQDKCYSTVHYGADNASHKYTSIGADYFKADGKYHTFGIKWNKDSLEPYYDGRSIGGIYFNKGEGYETWPFDQPFYIILNLAIGGDLGGAINSDMAKAEYDIDYVRVYQ